MAGQAKWAFFGECTRKIYESALNEAADTIEKLSAESIIEVCPHCENEIEMQWDINKRVYKAFCPVCGKRLMLCSECMNSGAGGCDYNSKNDSCRFNPADSGCVKVIHSAGGESYV